MLPAGQFFKTLFQPSKFQKLGVHRPKNKANVAANWVFGGVQQADASFAKDDKRINLFGLMQNLPKARLNHYSTRSVSEFMLKRMRGLPNRRVKQIDLSYWAERNFNTCEDHAIAHMLPATKAALGRLLKIDHVRHLATQTESVHRAKFKVLMQEREAVMMFLHLSLLEQSKAPSAEQIKAHLARLSKVQTPK
jgi:hypothetical protein